MERLIEFATISVANRGCFDVYLSDTTFRKFADERLSAQQRISLAILSAERPEGIGLRAIDAKLYELRHRFNDALDGLRQAHAVYTEHPSRCFSGRAGRPGEPSGAAWQAGAGVDIDLLSATSRA